MAPEGRADLAHPEVAGWMLGSLDPGEADTFRVHLAGCPHCQAAVAEFAPVSRALRRLPPAVEPPPELEERTLTAVRDAARAAERSPKTGTRARWPRWNPRLIAVAAAAVAAAIITVITVPGSKPAKTTHGVAIAHFALAPLFFPAGTSNYQPPGGQATGTDHGAAGWSFRLTVYRLPSLGSHQFYECWFVKGRKGHQRLVSGGTITVGPSGAGSFTITTSADPHVFKTMEITQERLGETGPGAVILTGQARLHSVPVR